MDRPRTDLDRRKRRRWFISGAAIAAVMAAGIALATFEPMAPRVDAKTLYIDVVTRGDLLRRVRGAGTLVPREQRWIAAAAEGRVERVIVRPGADRSLRKGPLALVVSTKTICLVGSFLNCVLKSAAEMSGPGRLNFATLPS